MKKLIALLIAGTLLLACANPSSTTPSAQVTDIEVPNQTTGFTESFSVSPETAQEGINAFSIDLFKQAREEGVNTLVAPVSAVYALGMVMNGADRETLKAFEDVLGNDASAINSWAYTMLDSYSRLPGSTQSSFVNSLWISPKLTLNQNFASMDAGIYKAALKQLDFNSPGAAKAINEWIQQETDGMIQDAVKEFPENSRLAVVNVSMLKNKFITPFKTPDMLWTMDFMNADGSVSTPIQMSNGIRDEEVIYSDNSTSVLLPYDDGRLGLLLTLPDENSSVSEVIDSWGGQTIKDMIDTRQTVYTSLLVPRFELKWDGSLNQALQKMGLEIAFDPSAANFSLLSQEEHSLAISDVIHQTVFKVNEKGTEAAAATVVDVAESAAPMDFFDLSFNRPFIAGIVDLETGLPLFLGSVESLPSEDVKTADQIKNADMNTDSVSENAMDKAAEADE